VVAAHPATTFIGVHVGCYAEDLGWVSRMLVSPPGSRSSAGSPGRPGTWCSATPAGSCSAPMRSRPAGPRTRFTCGSWNHRRVLPLFSLGPADGRALAHLGPGPAGGSPAAGLCRQRQAADPEPGRSGRADCPV